jgi:uncharacterized YigZ family protein
MAALPSAAFLLYSSVMYKLTKTETFEQDIKKSRFVAYAAPVSSEDEAKRFIASVSHADATHNCWAYKIGSIYRFSDDGEPSGTAGKPILQAIEGQEIDNVAVVVTRWYGGILLGTGGLVRAYGSTASNCLKNADKKLVVAFSTLSLSCSFADSAKIRTKAGSLFSFSIEKEDFTADGVRLLIKIPSDEADYFISTVTDLTRGQTIIEKE